MTEKEAVQKMEALVEEEIEKDTFLYFFFKPDILFRQTRIMEPWEKRANIKRPEILSDSNEAVAISIKGIIGWTHELSWDEIVATGLKTQIIHRDSGNHLYLYQLLICLQTGEIVQIRLGNIDKFHGQFGHFLEEFREEYFKNKKAQPL